MSEIFIGPTVTPVIRDGKPETQTMTKLQTIAFLALLLLGCTDEPEGEDTTFRGDYWAAIQCSGGSCWGLHPLGVEDDLWAKLIRREQLLALVDSGRYIPDATGTGFGPGCAVGKTPTTTPVVWCLTISGTEINRCFGGDGVYFTEIRPACAPASGFAAANTDYAPGSCDVLPPMPWAVFDSMMGHYTKLNVARVGLDGDSLMLYPGCAL